MEKKQRETAAVAGGTGMALLNMYRQIALNLDESSWRNPQFYVS
jgi:hypothetical protein